MDLFFTRARIQLHTYIDLRVHEFIIYELFILISLIIKCNQLHMNFIKKYLLKSSIHFKSKLVKDTSKNTVQPAFLKILIF